MKAVAVITANEGVRGGKTIGLRKTMQDALEDGCKSVKNVFVMRRTESMEDVQASDIILDEAINKINEATSYVEKSLLFHKAFLLFIPC